MKTSSKTMFFSLMIISTLMVMSSSNWLNMWIGLEMNLMAFIPLISESKNKFSSQTTMTYFLIQSMASMLFLMTMLMNKYIMFFISESMIKTFILLIMMMKMGMPPFHMWFPEMMNKMKWNMCLILMTWQKLAPMFITSMVIEVNKITMSVICLSAIVGAVGGVNQTSTRKIMAYSSINHMSWMLSCAMNYKKSWMMYLFMYSMMMLIMAKMMNLYNIMYINQMNIFFKNNMDKIIVIVTMLSIGGLPPFLGFFPKWMAIEYMIKMSEVMMMIVMVMSSLITIMYYLRLSSSMNLIFSHSQKWMFKPMTSKITSMWLMFINLAFPLIIMLYNFY
uniref:NADH-ubiquinone oxidoreductase chain 2 n=1 Tax=Lasiolabops cosmopolites TaxID=2813038 RepID=A0A8T9ZXU3_9HEMI|nr:NADH dehydrogenase subunit 2 [Lasiolabops cosmopolites]